MYLTLSLIVMSLITYCTRVLPISVFNKKIKSRFIKSFLYYVPYSVLSCMTFPAIYYSTNNLYTAIIGTGLSLILSFFKLKLIYVVIITVCAVFGFSYLFY